MRGRLFVMTGASGVGKGTVRAKVLERTRLFYSISMTTRPPRPGEVDGVDYYFVDRPTFEALVREDGFLSTRSTWATSTAPPGPRWSGP